MTPEFVTGETGAGERMERFGRVVRRTFEASGAVVERTDGVEDWQVYCEGRPERRISAGGRKAEAMLGASETGEQWATVRGRAEVGAGVPVELEGDERWMGVVRRDPDDFARTWAIWVLADGTDGWGGEDVELLRGMLEEWSDAERLETRVKRFELATENMNDLVALHAPDGTYRWVSSSFEKVVDYPSEQIVGQNPYDFCHPDDRERVREQAHEPLLDGTESARTEYRIQSRDGEWVWLEALGHRIEDDDGNLVGLQVTSRDITRRREIRTHLQETNERLEALNDAVPVAIVTVGVEGRVTGWNRAAEDIFGWTEEEVRGRSVGGFLVPEGRTAEFKRFLKAACEEGDTATIETQRRTKDEGVIDVRLSSAPVVSPDGEVREVMGLLEDITERKEQQRALETSEKRFRSLFEEAGIGVAIVSSDWVIQEVNPAMAEMFGYEREEMAGVPVREVSVDDDTLEQDRREHEKLMEGEHSSYTLEKHFERADGTRIWGRLTVSMVRDETGGPDYLIGMIEDITEQKRAKEQLVYRASHDGLTGLLNRQTFERELERVIDENRHREDGPIYAVMFLDLDEFKVVNDSLGHRVGDELLKAVAERIERALRDDDVVARLGGDEFAILLRNAGACERIGQIVSRLLEALEKPVVLDGHTLHPSASLGVVISEGEYTEPSRLLQDADAAMYHAKGAGSGAWEVFERPMRRQASRMVQLEEELRGALEDDEIVAYFQPIVGLEGQSVAGFEALVRWEHPEGDLLRPGAFLGVAERAGLMASIDHTILTEVCRAASDWRDFQGPDELCVSVNCSGQHFLEEEYLDRVSTIVDEADTEGWQLVLEVTENLLLEDNKQLEEKVERLEALDARICIDDFGTGYSSLSMLHRLPIDWLKIDRSFVEPIAASDASFPLLTSIRAMAENLGIDVVAEGVETEAQLEWLKANGFELGQGYYFGRPRPIEEIVDEFGEGVASETAEE